MCNATEHDSERAELDRMVGRMCAAGAPLGADAIETDRGAGCCHPRTRGARRLRARYLAVGPRGRPLAFHALRVTYATIGSENERRSSRSTRRAAGGATGWPSSP